MNSAWPLTASENTISQEHLQRHGSLYMSPRNCTKGVQFVEGCLQPCTQAIHEDNLMESQAKAWSLHQKSNRLDGQIRASNLSDKDLLKKREIATNATLLKNYSGLTTSAEYQLTHKYKTNDNQSHGRRYSSRNTTVRTQVSSKTCALVTSSTKGENLSLSNDAGPPYICKVNRKCAPSTLHPVHGQSSLDKPEEVYALDMHKTVRPHFPVKRKYQSMVHPQELVAHTHESTILKKVQDQDLQSPGSSLSKEGSGYANSSQN